jgi:esterase/lipase
MDYSLTKFRNSPANTEHTPKIWRKYARTILHLQSFIICDSVKFRQVSLGGKLSLHLTERCDVTYKIKIIEDSRFLRFVAL